MKLDFRFTAITISMILIIILAIDYNKKINTFNSSYLHITSHLYEFKHNIFKHENIINEAILKLYFNNDQTANNFKNFKEIEEHLKNNHNLKINYPKIYKDLINIIEHQNNILEDTNEYIKRNSTIKNSLSILYRKIKLNEPYEEIYYKNFVKFLTSSMYQQNYLIENYKVQNELFKYFEKTKNKNDEYKLNYIHINILHKEIPKLKRLISQLSKNTIKKEIDTLIEEFKYKSNIYKKDIQDKFYFILIGTIIFFTIILILIKNIKNHLEELRHKDKLLYKQSKHAAMGEMIDAIAHQWSQPINVIKMRTDFLTAMKDPEEQINRKEIKIFQTKVNEQLDHMLKTLNEFRSFLRPNKTTKLFSVEESIQGVLLLLKDELIKNQIIAKIDTKLGFKIDGIENEFKHVLINLINNSKDAFITNKIKKREITIFIDKNKILVQDNAGGIPQNLIKRIFEANFTTKKEGEGTGIGLYMTKQILDKIAGKISAQNTDNGVVFSIIFNEQ